MKLLVHILPLLIFTVNIKAESINPQLIGTWQGLASFKQEQTRLAVQFREDNGILEAKISLMDIGVSGWPATNVKATSDGVNITLPSDSGPQHLKLELAEDKIFGTWDENNYKTSAAVNLERSNQSILGSSEKKIMLEGKAGAIGASLFLPEGEGPFPAVVFLHGSGPQTRDTNRFAAERFAELGIASLIFDKRGVGESAGSFDGVSFYDLADDALTAANYLDSLAQISRVGFWGHSQGGWVAPLAATQWQQTAFVITSAGPAVSPTREGEWEFVYPMLRLENGNEFIPIIREIVSTWHQGVRTENWQKFNTLVSQHHESTWFKQAGLNNLSAKPNEIFLTSYKAFMDYQPLTTLKALKCPMLAIFADDDESIDSKESISIIKELVSSGLNVKLKVYSGYSHNMRKTSYEGTPLRFPNYPSDYFKVQSQFIHDAVTVKLGHVNKTTAFFVGT
jgi:pimeloyl-ACP methyl ester carboxylesterase